MMRHFKLLTSLILCSLLTSFASPLAIAQSEETSWDMAWEAELENHLADLETNFVSYGRERPTKFPSEQDTFDFSLASNLKADYHSDTCGCNTCCPGWYVAADYLNWQVERDDLAFGIFDPTGLGVPTAGAPVMSLDLGSQSGVRGSFGRRTPEGWELGIAYTFLSADDAQTFAPGGGRVLAVQSTPATGLTTADSVSASSEFDYHVVDLEAAHWFHPTDAVSAQLLGGVRFATIDHALQARYNGGAFMNGQADVTTNLDAFGGRFGGALHWTASEKFSVFAKTSLSVLKADTDARRHEVNGGAVVINATRPTDQILTAVDLSVGFRYHLNGWSIAGGYEWTNWFNAVSPLEFSDSFNGGTLGPTARDLGLHGFVANVSYSW